MGKNEVEVLDSPIWIMIVNIVALEMLGDRMPKLGSGSGRKESKAVGGSSDEDPYSLTASASSRSGSGKTAPDKSGDLSLDSDSYLPAKWALRRQQREDIEEDEYVTASHPRLRGRDAGSSGRDSDPYYSGYSARVPTFVGEQKRERASRRDERRYEHAMPEVPGRPGANVQRWAVSVSFAPARLQVTVEIENSTILAPQHSTKSSQSSLETHVPHEIQ